MLAKALFHRRGHDNPVDDNTEPCFACLSGYGDRVGVFPVGMTAGKTPPTILVDDQSGPPASLVTVLVAKGKPSKRSYNTNLYSGR